MHLVMFDIDGTLINSSIFEDECYLKAVQKTILVPVETDWTKYRNVTDSGILDEIIERNDLLSKRYEIHSEVKSYFISYIEAYLSQSKINEIPGAAAFIQLLRQRNDVVLSLATGGWEETAKLKLNSAGIDYSGISFASSSDHMSRTGIMKITEDRCFVNEFSSKSYFGDAIWDKKASEDLGYNFILVGNRFSHTKQLMDFINTDHALALIGLYK